MLYQFVHDFQGLCFFRKSRRKRWRVLREEEGGGGTKFMNKVELKTLEIMKLTKRVPRASSLPMKWRKFIRLTKSILTIISVLYQFSLSNILPYGKQVTSGVFPATDKY